MPELLILGHVTKANSPKYRGTDRSTPYYVDELHVDASANQAFLRYVDKGGQTGVIHDLDFAKKLVTLYSSMSPPQYFEIIEVTAVNQPPKWSDDFLGFDLSANYHYSLLSWGLEIDRKPIDDDHNSEVVRLITPLLRLVKSMFQPMLNSSGLFDDKDSAIILLRMLERPTGLQAVSV